MILTNFAFLYTSIQECPELKLSSHGRKVHSLGRPVPAIEGLVAGTRLSPLIACSVDTGDRGLLSAFVEWWQRETSSFHLSVGELTITLDDVSSLLHLLGCTLFANKSATNVHVVYLVALRDLSMTERYAWGVAALVHMYDQLNDASMSHNRQLGGYITLLQVTNMFFIHSC